jgi:hypothetical protein
VLEFRPFPFDFYAGGPGSGRNPGVAVPPAAEGIPPAVLRPADAGVRRSERKTEAERPQLVALITVISPTESNDYGHSQGKYLAGF